MRPRTPTYVVWRTKHAWRGVNIHQAIRAYYGEAADVHHRYRSWEHCYRYFRSRGPDGLAADRDHAALQLAFYLASWGMYRGSSFLLRHTYTVHHGVIDLIAEPRFTALRDADFGASETDDQFVPSIRELIGAVRHAYKPFASTAKSGRPTDTLITKVILGTFGCLPACDRYFINGFKSEGFRYSYLNEKFIECVLGFCQANLADLRREQASIEASSGVSYPLMKLVDMYFWQIGYDQDTR